jgi:hypothetical protein
MSQLVDPFNVNFRAKGVESNGQWTPIPLDSTPTASPLIQNWSSVAVSSDGRFVIACVNEGQVFTSSNYGYNMVPDTTLPSSAAWSGVSIAIDSDTSTIKAAACINGGGIYTAILNTSSFTWTWTLTNAPTPANWSSIAFSVETISGGYQSNYIAACINNPTTTGSYGIYVATNSGSTWTWTQSTNLYDNWYAISYSGSSNNFVVCINEGSSSARIYQGVFSNPVWNWTLNQPSISPPPSWTSIASNIYGTNIFVCGTNQNIYIGTYSNSIWTWTESSSGATSWSSIASSSTGQYLVACVNGGGMYCSFDYGTTWTQQVNGLSNSAWSCVASSSSGSFLVGAVNNGYIYISPYFQGIQWNSSYNIPTFSWGCVASDSSGQNLIACASNDGYFPSSMGVYISNDYGISWNSSTDTNLSTQPFNSVATNNNGTILAACSEPSSGSSNVYISVNGGDNWEVQIQLTYPNPFSFITLDSSGTYAAVINTTRYNTYSTTQLTLGYYNTTWTWTPQTIALDTTSSTFGWSAIKYSGDSTKIYAAGTDYTHGSNNGIWLGTQLVDGTYSWVQKLQNSTYTVYANIACSSDGTYVAATSIGFLSTGMNQTSYVWVNDSVSTFTQALSSASNVSGAAGYVGITMDTTGQKMAVTFYTTLTQTVTGGTVPLVPSCVYISSDYGLNWIIQTQGLPIIDGNGNPTTNTAWNSISSNDNMDRLITCAVGIGLGVYPSSVGIYTAFISETSWTPQLNALPSKNVFSKLTSSSDGKYLAVAAENNSSNYVYGGIWISSDSGSTWIQSTAGNYNWNAIASDNTGQYLVAGVYGGALYTSSNYGYSWTAVTVGLPFPANWRAISFSCNSDSTSTSQYVYAQSDGGYIYYSSDRGITWTVSVTSGTWGFWSNGMASSSDGSIAYACIDYGSTSAGYLVGIWKSSDYGQNFNQVFSTAADWNYVATDSTGQYVVAVSIGVGIYFSSDFGSNWSQILPQIQYWTSITLVNTGLTLLVNAICINSLMYSGTYNITTPAWTWTFNSTTSILPSSNWNDIHASSDDGTTKLVLCSTTGGIWTSTNNGTTWTQSTSFYTNYNTAITSSSTGQNLAAIINNGTIYTSSNYGSSWSQLTSSTLPSFTNWYTITSSITGQYIVASTTLGEIYVSSNYGKTWISSIIGANPVVSISSSGQYIVAATNLGTIYISSNYGVTWTPLTTASGLPSSAAWSAISISSSGQYIVAAVNGGTIYISSNFGVAWTQLTTANGLPSTAAWSAIAISNTGQYIVATINGGIIYFSFNYGSNWSPVSTTSNGLPSTAAWSAVAISGTGQYMFATINGNKIYYSASYGTSWIEGPTTADGSLPPTAAWTGITSSTSGQYLAAIAPNPNSTPNPTTDIYIYSNFMDIGNIWGSLIDELQILVQKQN